MSPPTVNQSALEHRALLEELDAEVRALRRTALRLKESGGEIQAVERNLDRILSSVRMLEINVSDLLHEPDSLASWAVDDGSM